MTEHKEYSVWKFFVYGSLSEGLVHFSKIKDFISCTTIAQTRGSAYKLKVGFPVLLEQGLDLVPGDLIELKEISSINLLVAFLDEFHGFFPQDESKSLYIRKEIEVESFQRQEKAWCYLLNPTKLPKTAVKIQGGDWKACLAEEPTLTSKLTESQRAYVLRLGSCKGREIVPIDLPLYRELMNLELIVDKGRRLALSKFGQEVFRYL